MVVTWVVSMVETWAYYWEPLLVAGLVAKLAVYLAAM